MRDGERRSLRKVYERVERAAAAAPLKRALAIVVSEPFREKLLSSFVNYVGEEVCKK